jgi:hypothetical protein
MKYFENESDVITLQELSIENRLDRVAIFGSLDITRDKQGLELALKLQCIVNGIVDALQQVQNELPEQVPPPAPTEEVDNPF